MQEMMQVSEVNW